jgi:hypothetical protein
MLASYVLDRAALPPSTFSPSSFSAIDGHPRGLVGKDEVPSTWRRSLAVAESRARSEASRECVRYSDTHQHQRTAHGHQARSAVLADMNGPASVSTSVVSLLQTGSPNANASSARIGDQGEFNINSNQQLRVSLRPLRPGLKRATGSPMPASCRTSREELPPC